MHMKVSWSISSDDLSNTQAQVLVIGTMIGFAVAVLVKAQAEGVEVVVH